MKATYAIQENIMRVKWMSVLEHIQPVCLSQILTHPLSLNVLTMFKWPAQTGMLMLYAVQWESLM